jgi:hypothetical protein
VPAMDRRVHRPPIAPIAHIRRLQRRQRRPRQAIPWSTSRRGRARHQTQRQTQRATGHHMWAPLVLPVRPRPACAHPRRHLRLRLPQWREYPGQAAEGAHRPSATCPIRGPAAERVSIARR